MEIDEDVQILRRDWEQEIYRKCDAEDAREYEVAPECCDGYFRLFGCHRPGCVNDGPVSERGRT